MLSDSDCVAFLQWALPRLRMRWPGFRKVRQQACKRIRRRIGALKLSGVAAYRQWLEDHPDEWEVLDGMCRITISRFYRDRGVFDALAADILPGLARRAKAEGRTLRAWSAGCASGEEPYTLSLIWHFLLKAEFPKLDFSIIATDAVEHMLARARTGCYPPGALKELSDSWLDQAFFRQVETFCIQPRFKAGISWMQQDIRRDQPAGRFDLILCRNLVATYFDADLQRSVFTRIKGALRAGGMLVLGCHEQLPEGIPGWIPKTEQLYEASG